VCLVHRRPSQLHVVASIERNLRGDGAHRPLHDPLAQRLVIVLLQEWTLGVSRRRRIASGARLPRSARKSGSLRNRPARH
jgi:hypothetical protein